MSGFSWPVRVYWEDTDASGVVYHANYLRWFERARTEWLRALGHDQESMRVRLGIAFTVAGLDVRYLKPARLDDALVVHVGIAEARKASLVFEQQLLRAECGTRLADARVRVGCVDAASFKPRPLPEIAWA